MDAKDPSTLVQADPCYRQRTTYENCLRLKFFDSKCFLDHIEYKDCILLQKKIEKVAGQGCGTLTSKHADR
jgi:hypothetical protein